MKIDEELIIPYSIAIGIFNFIFTGILVTILSWIFHFSLTWKIMCEPYIIGYIVLWILNIRSIIEGE